MLDKLVDELTEILPGFGRRLGIDSKAICSLAKRNSKKAKADGRRELDADYGVKKYKGKRENGTLWEKVVSWFGYKIFLVVDVEYELPIGYKVTKASKSDMTELLPMIEESKQKHPETIRRTETMAADRGFDSEDNNVGLWDEHQIKPVIDIRNMWKDGEETRLINEDEVDNIVYDYKGNVHCINPETGKKLKMNFCGYEKDRNCLKYRCQAAACGVECKVANKCGTGKHGEYGRIVRIPLEKNRRVFTPLARSSYAFKREYKKRTAVERVNSRLDVSFGFERHYIRVLKKMKLRCSLALVVMLAMALGRAKQNQEEYMRS